MIPRHHLARTGGVVGEFRLSEERDRETVRTLRVARLVRVDAPTEEVVPALFDAAVIYAAPNCWTVTGREREEVVKGLAEPAHLQSWWMKPLPLEELLELRRARVTKLSPK